MTRPSMTAADVLREARRLIVEKGWVQGHLGGILPAGDRLCAGVAIDGAVTDVGPAMAASRFFKLAIGRPSIVQWNDEIGRTEADIYAAFDRAIIIAESPGDHP